MSGFVYFCENLLILCIVRKTALVLRERETGSDENKENGRMDKERILREVQARKNLTFTFFKCLPLFIDAFNPLFCNKECESNYFELFFSGRLWFIKRIVCLCSLACLSMSIYIRFVRSFIAV